MTFLLALVPALLLFGLFSGSGADPDDLDLMGDEQADDGDHDGMAELLTVRAGDDAGLGADSIWGQSDDDELPEDSSIVTAEAGDSPTFITDFDAQHDALDIELEHGTAGGTLGVEAFGAGADSAITLNGVAIVILVGVVAASVNLNRVSVRREG